MTATPLTSTDPRWALPETVEAIAAGSDWAARLAEFWKHVSPDAHDLAHPHAVFGCPGCPGTETCPSCGLPVEVCKNPVGHYRISREGEGLLRSGVATYNGGGDGNEAAPRTDSRRWIQTVQTNVFEPAGGGEHA